MYFVGIWDCLTSQQVVDVIRLLISQGKKLKEVCEIICDHCLAPDTNSGAGIGCDNMTILVVALLNGRTEEEWYEWVYENASRNTEFQSLPHTLQGNVSPFLVESQIKYRLNQFSTST